MYIYIYIQIELGQRNPRVLEVARNWVFARKSLLVRNLLGGITRGITSCFEWFSQTIVDFISYI